MSQVLGVYGLPRIAMRYRWLQAHGLNIVGKAAFARLSPAKFAARHGSLEEAIEEWRQCWLQTPEGRLYGGNTEAADFDRWAVPQTCKSLLHGSTQSVLPKLSWLVAGSRTSFPAPPCKLSAPPCPSFANLKTVNTLARKSRFDGNTVNSPTPHHHLIDNWSLTK